MDVRNRLILALDRPDLDSALELASMVAPSVGAFKVGLELFTAEGPRAVRALTERGYRVFLDAKFHDIPNTVAGACRSATRIGAWMMNIHASGGRAMLTAAAEAVQQEADAGSRPILIGVTVLTSLDRAMLKDTLGIDRNIADLAIQLARLCQECGLDGVVASPREVLAIRRACGERFMIVTPGIRRQTTDSHDQQRIATPAQALQAGADYLVIGRDVTAAADPGQAARDLLEECRSAIT